jgi:hypothetical protein
MQQGERNVQFKAPSTIKEMVKPTLVCENLEEPAATQPGQEGFYQPQDLGGSLLLLVTNHQAVGAALVESAHSSHHAVGAALVLPAS